MARIAIVVITVAGLSWSPTLLCAQQALKTITTPSPRLPAFPTRAHSVAQLDRAAWRALAEPAPWRPSLSTAPLGALPARRSWNKTHTILAGVFVVGLMIDAAQTRALARDGWSTFREGNPLLGERPSVGRINTYTALVGLGVLGAAVALPPRLRPWLLGGAIAVQALTVARSLRMGIPVKFP